MPDKYEEFGDFYEQPDEEQNPEREAPVPAHRRRSPKPRLPRRRRRRYGSLRGGSQLAGLGQRFGAHILDSLIFAVTFLPAYLWFFESIDDTNGEFARERLIPPVLGGIAAVLWGATLIYHAYLLSTRGQSIGKMALKIRIVDYQTEANPGFARAFLMRSVVPGIFGALCNLFNLVDVLFIFGEERRCVHDLMASTKVIQGEPRDVDPDAFA